MLKIITYDSKEEVLKHQGKDEGAQSLHLSEPKNALPTSEFFVVA